MTNLQGIPSSLTSLMDKSENQSHDDFRLRKDEIIRGHDAYSRVLQNSISISSDFIKAFVNIQSKEVNLIDFTNSPLFTNNVKVGFIIAKKKIKKTVLRNRIKRLLREAYRLNKNLFEFYPSKLNIIFSLTDNGYEFFLLNKKVKYNFVETEIKKLAVKLKNYFSNK